MPLGNYRDVPFSLGGINFQVGGFRRPDGPGAFNELRQNHGVTDVISLDGDHWTNFKAGGLVGGYHSGRGFEVYDHFNAPYQPQNRIDPQIYENIYREVMAAAGSGRKVAIHCGAGDGRTGTALSSLMLRQLLETEYAANPGAIGGVRASSESIHMHHGVNGYGDGDVAVTPLVKQAILQVRNSAIPPHANSVESQNDVESLMLYEATLREEFVKKYQHESAARPGVAVNENEASVGSGANENEMRLELADDILLQIEAATDALDSEPQETEGFVSRVVQSIQRIYQQVRDIVNEAAAYVSNMISSR